MNLQTFIEQSLVDIATGVGKAREKYAGIAVDVTSGSVGGPRTKQLDPVYMIDFDISVSAGRDSEISASGGASIILVAQVDADAKQTDRHESLNRIKFSVPVCFSSTYIAPKAE